MTDTVPGPGDLLSLMPHAQAIGVRLKEAAPDRVHGVLEWSPGLCTAGGILHGGALMTLADSVGAVCAYLNLPPGATTSTVESKTNFFRALRTGSLTAIARPLHVGSSFIVVQTDLTDDQSRPIALTLQSQAVLPARNV